MRPQVAVGKRFEGPREIAAGWTTFRFTNASSMIHFGIIDVPPDGVTAEEFSSCRASMTKGGDLGEFGPGLMVGAIDKICFEEEVGVVLVNGANVTMRSTRPSSRTSK